MTISHIDLERIQSLVSFEVKDLESSYESSLDKKRVFPLMRFIREQGEGPKVNAWDRLLEEDDDSL